MREYISKTQPEILLEIRYEYRTQHYKVWDGEFDDVVLFSREMCETKLTYMHQNPIRAGILKEATDYGYSSAKFYEYWHSDIQSELLHFLEVF
ncbi:hypothetical protein [Runella slithyformis]|uniref:hypothetical protein n=1 Tax=Runella slithyformis TaxID=106 RepID=UPI0002E3BDED|nr:hypothetical protein [Runella slithyformis]